LNAVAVSFLCSLLIFILIGVWSMRQRRTTTDDYLLASRSIGPWVTALSAVATNNSGFMFIGLIGTTYTMGISAIWIMAGFILGDYLMWFWVHRRLRERSEEQRARTIASFVARGVSDGGNATKLLAAIITLLFLGTYAAAQLNAGGKALHVLFGWPLSLGAVVGATIVLIYCFSGGIRASMWTDVAQSVLMIGAIWLLQIVVLEQVGGWHGLWTRLREIDPQLLKLTPPNLRFGFLLFVLGWMGAGVGVVGQPHIMVRAMAVRSGQDLHLARHIYLVWYLAFTFACYGVALGCRVLLPDVGSFDAELALPTLALEFLPPVLVGVVLAGLFSATMSTADSQLLSCSAALTQDIFPQWQNSYARAKAGTAIITLLVLGIAMVAHSSVFTLVTMSWSALGAGLGPLLVVRAMHWPVTGRAAIAMMSAGVGTVFVWRYALGWSDHIFDVLPGMLAGYLVYLAFRAKQVGTARA
jgi:sodium/proline symporter